MKGLRPTQAIAASLFLAPPRWVYVVVGAISAIFTAGLIVPWKPASGASYGYYDYFDFSWMLVLNDAIATGKQFGKQFILPYGPLGFITTSVYDPRTYLILVFIRLAIAGVVFAAIWRPVRQYLVHPLLILPWVMGVVILMSASPDHFYAICALLLWINYFVMDGGRPSAATWAMIVLEAAASLAKVNMLMQAVVVVGAISVDQIMARRWRGLLVPAVYGGSVALFYLLARQSPSSVAAFIRAWAQVAGGHVDAVSLIGPDIEVVMYLVAAGLALIAVGDHAWRASRWRAVVPVGAIALVYLLLYKHSFVRQDFAHATIGPLVVFAMSLLYAPILWTTATGKIRQWASIGLVLVAGTVASSSLTGNPVPDEQAAPTRNDLPTFAWAQITEAGADLWAGVGNLFRPSRLHEEWEAARAVTREQNPIPVRAVVGTVDVYPHRQDVLFAYGFNYQPRPATQSLLATAPGLARADAEHLLGPSAPDSILFDIEPVDRNYPSFQDGLSWPELLTRYDIVDASAAFLILRRAPAPRSWRLTPIGTIAGRIRDSIPIPAATDGPIWAKFHLKRKLAGRIWGDLYKAPPVGIHARLLGQPADNDAMRFLTSLAEEGFLLSPLVKDRAAFARLESATWRKDLEASMVDTVQLTVDGDIWFEPEVTIELFKLDFPHQDLSGIRLPG